MNHRSHVQKKKLLKLAGYRLPMKQGRETSDYLALLKLQLKDPESKIIPPLLKLSKLEKQVSSYLNYEYDEKTSRLMSTMYPGSTETWRNSSGLDPWNRGMNVQTIPKKLKTHIGFSTKREQSNAS